MGGCEGQWLFVLTILNFMSSFAADLFTFLLGWAGPMASRAIQACHVCVYCPKKILVAQLRSQEVLLFSPQSPAKSRGSMSQVVPG